MADLIKKINDSDYEIGKKYRMKKVVQDRMISNLDSKVVGTSKSSISDGSDLEQMFNVYLSDKGVWSINLNSSFYAIDIPEQVFSIFITKSDMLWTTISYQIYGTTRLAWLLMKLNDVRDANIFNVVKTGTGIKYLEKSKYVDSILYALSEGELK